MIQRYARRHCLQDMIFVKEVRGKETEVKRTMNLQGIPVQVVRRANTSLTFACEFRKNDRDEHLKV